MRYAPLAVAALAARRTQAAKDERTFAVLRFYGDGPMMEGRVDPLVDYGKTATHMHTIQGGSNFGISATGEDLMQSQCSSALIVGDNSAYWAPKLYFHDAGAGTVEPVDLYYMNVYYFFEPTDDDVVAFPVGLGMLSGDASLRECPDFGGQLQTDGANASNIQPTVWTCPRLNNAYDPPSWPSAAESDGSRAGIQDPASGQSGQGLPFGECDGYASPLRMDLHFPSCYDPSKNLTDYQNNMAWPTVNYATGKQNCPEGFLHVPHLFYELYWNTPAFSDRWTPFAGSQPFVLSNGDLSGCSAHADFLAAWDTDTLQHIIDTCNAGDIGMDQCAGVQVHDRSTTCNAASPVDERVAGALSALPGNNPLEGWGQGTYTDGHTDNDDHGSDNNNDGGALTLSVSASVEVAAATAPVSSPEPTPAVQTLEGGVVVTTWVYEFVTETATVWERSEPTQALPADEVKRDGSSHAHAHGHGHLHRPRSPRNRFVR